MSGIKADALSYFSSTARGAAGGRSTSFGGMPSRSAPHCRLHVWKLLELAGCQLVTRNLVLHLKTSGLFRGCQLNLAARKRRRGLPTVLSLPAEWANCWHACSTTHCQKCVPTHTPGPTHRPRFDGGFVFHTMMTSSARKTVWVRGRARTASSMRSRMDTSA